MGSRPALTSAFFSLGVQACSFQDLFLHLNTMQQSTLFTRLVNALSSHWELATLETGLSRLMQNLWGSYTSRTLGPSIPVFAERSMLLVHCTRALANRNMLYTRGN